MLLLYFNIKYKTGLVILVSKHPISLLKEIKNITRNSNNLLKVKQKFGLNK